FHAASLSPRALREPVTRHALHAAARGGGAHGGRSLYCGIRSPVRCAASALCDGKALQRREGRLPSAAEGGVGRRAPRPTGRAAARRRRASTKGVFGAAQAIAQCAAGSRLCPRWHRSAAEAREPLAAGLRAHQLVWMNSIL